MRVKGCVILTLSVARTDNEDSNLYCSYGREITSLSEASLLTCPVVTTHHQLNRVSGIQIKELNNRRFVI